MIEFAIGLILGFGLGIGATLLFFKLIADQLEEDRQLEERCKL